MVDTSFVLFETTIGEKPTTCISCDTHAQHLLTGHGARDITNRKLKETHANITKEVIQLYVDLCETCALKKRKVRKSLVVKPIVCRICSTPAVLISSICRVSLMGVSSGFACTKIT